MWVSVALAVATVVAVLVWLRIEARSDRLRAAAAGPARRPRSRREAAEHGDHARGKDEHDHAHVAPPILSTEVTQVIHSVVAEVDRPPVAVAAAYDTVFDVQAVSTGQVPAAETPAEELPPGSWRPVPVPKPTYALKAKAEPRYTESGIPADVFDTPEFAEEADELDERARFARRAASH